MANSVFISSCSRRELARRRPGRIVRRTAARRAGTVARYQPSAARLAVLVVALAILVGVAALLLPVGL